MIVYISGPMTGLPDLNYPAFDAATVNWLKSRKALVVINPAEIGRGIDKFRKDTGSPPATYNDYVAACIKKVPTADAIALLPGWDKSTGARIEIFIAMALGLKVYDAITMEEIKMGVELVFDPRSGEPINA